ncbi:serine hydrolase domain-containing protein [Bradyrhizobium aeschynomenes]|uniref:serine hydrolase domain-containing protein n=1 Tax=Bradyrhizobium aeschynomenes TaxID=2734909 RepID=UPI0015569AC5|nr:serine hydrolase [Bradyrhizobium aeschynomenes]NPV20995.1 serine hydrolase [Bradyrhizobium aeschynomenes]
MLRIGINIRFAAALLPAWLLTANALAEDAGLARFPTADWATATPEDEGMDSAAVERLVSFGARERLDSLALVRHGRIVLDTYYAPYRADLPHAVNSTTKAVTGSLIATMLKDGVLDSIDHPVVDFFRDREIANLDARKQAITVRHLLNMTSGLEWDEGLGTGPEQSLQELRRAPDWVKYILDKPMAHAPGETFYYNSGNSHLLSAIISKLTGKTAQDYANEKLFRPLGIKPPIWLRDPQGLSTGGFGLLLKPRDMARFGYLYLRGGRWGDQQLLPPDWIDAVTHASVDMQTTFEPGLHYANQFWSLPEQQVFMSVGYHCQVIMVLPRSDIVAVMTAHDFCPMKKLALDIVGAVKSDDALARSPEAFAQLQKTVRDAAVEKPSAVAVAPAQAAAVSGRTYSFAESQLRFKTITLHLDDAPPHVSWDIYDPASPNGVLRLDSPIGLDGLYRINAPKTLAVPFSYRAMKGAWTDQRTFVVDLQYLTQGVNTKWTLAFGDDQMTITAKARDGRAVTITSEKRQ